ncbi:MAG TPA: carboxypeptidase-like regulatory domain-containing protein [Chitinophagaceae bacterium]|nr:carboxypeptidase-like regulatory domain-containing protein [Chitinophagaceae bacterium]
MKKIRLALVALAVSSAGLFSFKAFQANSIKGTVTPADKAVRAWAVSPTDTLKAEVQNGTFEIRDVKAGTYSVIIEAQEPYANTRKKDVVVEAEKQTTDIGEIILQPK